MIFRSKNFFLLFFLLFTFFAATAQDGYEISIKINNYDQTQCYLGYFYGDKQYLKDTAQVDSEGKFVFKGEKPLDAGVYMVVLPPDNQFFQVLVNDNEQHFGIETNYKDLTGEVKITDSKDNQLFYEYLSFLTEQRPIAESLRKSIEEAADDAKKKEKFEEKLSKLDESVFAFQRELVAKNPNSLTAAIIRSNTPVTIPEFSGKDEEIQLKKWYYSKQHYFDNIDLTDPRMVRTPFLYQKVTHFIEKLTVQHPDSINQSIDAVLKQMEKADDTYKYYLVHFLNEYAKSKIVGFDAV